MDCFSQIFPILTCQKSVSNSCFCLQYRFCDTHQDKFPTVVKGTSYQTCKRTLSYFSPRPTTLWILTWACRLLRTWLACHSQGQPHQWYWIPLISKQIVPSSLHLFQLGAPKQEFGNLLANTYLSLPSFEAGESGTTKRTWMDSTGLPLPGSAPPTMLKPQLAFSFRCRITVFGYWRLRGIFCQYIHEGTKLEAPTKKKSVHEIKKPHALWLYSCSQKINLINILNQFMGIKSHASGQFVNTPFQKREIWKYI